MAKQSKRQKLKRRARQLSRLYSKEQEKTSNLEEQVVSIEKSPVHISSKQISKSDKTKLHNMRLGEYVKKDLLKTLYFTIFVVVVICISVVIFSDFSIAADIREKTGIHHIDL